jgi:glycosyltransferase involved in cell wall biosynthesis
MKIFFDHYVFSYTNFGGISKYIATLLKYIPHDYWYTSTILSNNVHFHSLKTTKAYRFFPDIDFRGKGRIMFELNMPYTKYQLYTRKWDVFHATWFLSPFINGIKNKPAVVTIHDLIYDVFYGSKTKQSARVIKMGKESAARADKIIAVSNATKADMINFWGINEDKIQVIYHGMEKDKFPVLESRLIEKPYIFFAGGARAETKNFKNLIKAFSILQRKHRDLMLVCSGPAFNKSESDLLNKSGVLDNVVNFYATNPQMAQLYNDAEMLVLPSLYEGFGFPALEAMLYNCPVALANSSCLPEIGGNAALYFDPYSPEEMSEKMSLIIDDTDIRNNLVASGIQRLAGFSWKKNADEHIELYKSLM